jgi:hypothetical protein
VPGSPALAGNARGDLAAAWVEVEPRASRSVVKLVQRRAGGRLTRPRVVAAGYVGTPTAGNLSGRGVAVAVGARGELLVVVQRARVRPNRRTLEVRTGRIGGRLSRAQTLGPQQGFVDLAAAVGPSGRAIVAWGTQDVGEEANEAYRVHAALREPGRPRFTTSQVLDPGGPATRAAGTVAAALTPSGEATVIWSSPRHVANGSPVNAVRAAVAPRGMPSPRSTRSRPAAPPGT